MTKKKLIDVILIRIVLIVLLVLCHSFAIYNGSWSMPSGISNVPAYSWIASLSFSFMLETFVFLSGYLFGFQVREKYNGKVNFHNTVVSKAKRLLIPCFIFSLIYFLCFKSIDINSWKAQLYGVINGEGHLWFLPMLFWCFALLFIMERLKIKGLYALCLCLIFSLLPVPTLPFRLSSSLYYFIFFYIGFYIQRNDINVDRSVSIKNILLSASGYLLVFILSKTILNFSQFHLFLNSAIINKIALLIGANVIKIIYSSCGLAFIFMLSRYLLNNCNISINKSLIKLSECCFGVYIFQQFILNYIIYSDFFISTLGSYWLPWFAFLLALLGSIALSWATMKTKVGKFLIG